MQFFRLPVSPEVWNVLKFFITEVTLSFFLAGAWSILLQRKTAGLVHEGHAVQLSAIGSGRLSPFEVYAKVLAKDQDERLGHWARLRKIFCNNIDKAAIWFLNFFVFAALMAMEPGSGAIPDSAEVQLSITGKKSTLLYVEKFNENKIETIPRKVIPIDQIKLQTLGGKTTIFEHFNRTSKVAREGKIRQKEDNSITLSNVCGLSSFSSAECIRLKNHDEDLRVLREISIPPRQAKLFGFLEVDIIIEVEPLFPGGTRLCFGHVFYVLSESPFETLLADYCADLSKGVFSVQFFKGILSRYLRQKREIYEKPKNGSWVGHRVPVVEIKEEKRAAVISNHLPLLDVIFRLKEVQKLVKQGPETKAAEQVNKVIGDWIFAIVAGMLEGIGAEDTRSVESQSISATVDLLFFICAVILFGTTASILLLASFWRPIGDLKYPVSLQATLRWLSHDHESQ